MSESTHIMSEGNVLLVVNPAAQRGNGAQAAQVAFELLTGKLGANAVTLATTQHPGHAIDICASAPRQQYPTVIALGGDGIVHEAVNGFMKLPLEDRPRFGIIPVGSGNDYARTLGISENVTDAISQLLDARECAADIGCCNGSFFAETLSFGLDAAIALDTVERRKRTGEQGTILYMKSGLDQLLHHLDLFEFKATIDQSRSISGNIHMFAVQVGPTYGGGFRICPDADITDGMLDLCYATGPMHMLEATFKFLSAKDAHHTNFKNIHFDRASSLELSFNRRPPCQMDGEPHIADSYSIKVIPGALRVLRNASS